MTTAVSARQAMLDRLESDLLGPDQPDEVLNERPSDRYLVGILYPPGEDVARVEDDSPREEPARPALEGSGEVADVPIYRSLRPSTFGMSFRVRGTPAAVKIRLSGGRYTREETPAHSPEAWRRNPVAYEATVPLATGFSTAAIPGPLDLSLALRVVESGQDFAVTAVVSNVASGPGGMTWSEERALFQARLEIVAGEGASIVPRPFAGSAMEEEDRSARLLYRDVLEYAVGHTSSATWWVDELGAGIATVWLPRVPVPSFSADGSPEFSDWVSGDASLATWLAAASDGDLTASFHELSAAYRQWIEAEETKLDSLADDEKVETANRHLDSCRSVAAAIEDGVALLNSDPVIRRAFQLANLAMVMQYEVTAPGRGGLRWRPFQIAFQLICLRSLARPQDPGRGIMDLLWFPTGGGKTEAYLGLIAFLLFHRRLRVSDPDDGAGVAAIMRYTLRVLTAQQFQRAAAMVAACEEIRTREVDLGNTPFSLGLWVGRDGTPNTIADASTRPKDLKVLVACPRCGELITNPTSTERRQFCRNDQCLFHDRPVPIHVIDEDVYAARPSLLLATVDKFAQITRQLASGALFSLDRRYPPPDLILQDELHLISGPLGTVAGLYEIAIDEFCSWAGYRPKIVGSTATIRRASDQVTALFNREVRTFPPSGINHHDSGFALHDLSVPGRTYVGVPTTGRSPKFALQAVLASLAQGAASLRDSMPAAAVDPFWTCVGYFNSIRELGGAVVLVEDDVRRSIDRVALRRGETPRRLDTPSEVTSRVPTSDIPELLAQLAKPYPQAEIDIVLASNMISVGVDIPRLGLMVVNGQPKTTAEYIQATSRVGRQSVPGLVVVLYNVQRPRDRSRYESFEMWHRALYRDVEPTSVTPFAPRARDRALHGPLVALLRLLYPPPGDSPVLGPGRKAAVEAVMATINARAEAIDPAELEATKNQLQRLVDDWSSKERLNEWWWRQGHEAALLIGAEDNAALAATRRSVDSWATPNSMRDVEPTTRFRLISGGLRRPGGGT